MRLVFVGNGAAAARALAAAAPIVEVVAVATDDAAVTRAAGAAAAPVLPPDIVKDVAFAEYLRERSVDLLLNVYSLHVAAADVITAPSVGSFNLHPGPLPEFAGLNVPSWAIYEQVREHGVTLHWMDTGIDTGPVAYRAVVSVDDEETGLSLSLKSIDHGLRLVAELLHAAVSDRGAIPRIDQDVRRRRYFGAGPPHGGRIDWRAPAREVVAFVRAADYHPFPSPWPAPATACGDRSFGVAKAKLTGKAVTAAPGTIGTVSGTAVNVAAGDEWVMVERVRVDRGTVDALDVLPLDGCCVAA